MKDLVLFVNTLSKDSADAIRTYFKDIGEPCRVGVVLDTSRFTPKRKSAHMDVYITCDLSKESEIIATFKPLESQIRAVTCSGESNLSSLMKLAPHLPYVRTPTVDSIKWSTDKIHMRKRFRLYNPKMTPKYTVVKDLSQKTLDKVSKKVGFPVVVKPANLAMSLLVSDTYYEEEFKKTIQKMLKSIKGVYDMKHIEHAPKILVEQFMDGDMYSIDAYVNSNGKVYPCPPVFVSTGKSIGIDDFFNYIRITPTTLSKEQIDLANQVVHDSIHALGLRNTTCHVELLRTNTGWKVIELAPRIGGFRTQMYRDAYGIRHSVNDVLVRMGRKPEIQRKPIAHTAVMRIYPKKKGIIQAVKGLRTVRKLQSVTDVAQKLYVGDATKFSKEGGKQVADITLVAPTRAALLADIRRVEKAVEIIVE